MVASPLSCTRSHATLYSSILLRATWSFSKETPTTDASCEVPLLAFSLPLRVYPEHAAVSSSSCTAVRMSARSLEMDSCSPMVIVTVTEPDYKLKTINEIFAHLVWTCSYGSDHRWPAATPIADRQGSGCVYIYVPVCTARMCGCLCVCVRVSVVSSLPTFSLSLHVQYIPGTVALWLCNLHPMDRSTVCIALVMGKHWCWSVGH